jgi:hypothetical protein
MDDFSLIITFLVLARVVSYLMFCMLVASGIYLVTKLIRDRKKNG